MTKFLDCIFSRRHVLQLGALLVGVTSSSRTFGADTELAANPSIRNWIKDNLLQRTLYSFPVNLLSDERGRTGVNRDGLKWIEEQREGASWITRGFVKHNVEWIIRGWAQLDWGLKHQNPDGSFPGGDRFHSASFFMEALARACIIDPIGASKERVDGLKRACNWMMDPEVVSQGILSHQLFNHRTFILAATFGQAAFVTGDTSMLEEAEKHAVRGMAKQMEDGTSPERGGFDAGYQMIGAVMALRYLSILNESEHKNSVRNFVSKSLTRELTMQQPNGEIDITGSTRIGTESGRSGSIKIVPYDETFEALIYGSIEMNHPDWHVAAENVARYKGWITG